ncbi:MAG: DNA-processing protein DprA [Ignavibacteriaceae bacterium]
MSDLTISDLSIIKLLLSIEGIGPGKIRHLHRTFQSFKEIIESDIYKLVSVPGITESIAQSLIAERRDIQKYEDIANDELLRLNNTGGDIITIWDENYPMLLSKIYDPPIMLYVLGEITEQDYYSLAVVGTRVPTNYGKMMTEKLVTEISEKGLTVVSGLARGIDTAAHTAALKAGGRTIAVLGCGVDKYYPPENKKFYEEIPLQGAVISEYELGTQPDAVNFPRRNRIISGLSLGTLVIETKENGGAMQTANFALEQNREIFALPGNVNVFQSEGTNRLIKESKAKLVQTADDIFEELSQKIRPLLNRESRVKPKADLNMFQEKILTALGTEQMHIDLIAKKTGLSTPDCLFHLLSLEMEGIVKQLPGTNFIAY